MIKPIVLFVSVLLLFVQPSFAQASRLVAEVNLYFDGSDYVPEDSIIYNYSGGRGGDLEHTLKYDNSVNYNYISPGAGYDTGTLHEVQTFDASSNINTDTREYSIRYFYTYDDNNNMLTRLTQQFNPATLSWDNQYVEIYTYDANDNLLTWLSRNFTTGVWTNESNTVNTYDDNNNQMTSLHQVWSITNEDWVSSYYNVNTYNRANKLTTGVKQDWNGVSGYWASIDSIVVAYDAANNLILSTDYHVDPYATTHPLNRQVNTYDASNNQLTSLYQIWDVPTATWMNVYNTINSDFINGNPQEVINQQAASAPDTFANTRKLVYTYNSFGQETSMYQASWSYGAWVPLFGDYGARFYYATYTPSVQKIAANNCTVYPVPAKDMLHVAVNWKKTQPFTIQMIAMSGATVSQWQMPALKSYEGDFSISKLAAGNYIMKITGSYASSVQRIVVQ